MIGIKNRDTARTDNSYRNEQRDFRSDLVVNRVMNDPQRIGMLQDKNFQMIPNKGLHNKKHALAYHHNPLTNPIPKNSKGSVGQQKL